MKMKSVKKSKLFYLKSIEVQARFVEFLVDIFIFTLKMNRIVLLFSSIVFFVVYLPHGQSSKDLSIGP